MDTIKLTCPVAIKVKITEAYRTKMLEKLNQDLDEIIMNLSRIDLDKEKFIRENATEENINQINVIVQQMEMEKAKGMKIKANIEKDIEDMKHLGLGAEIIKGTMEHIVEVKVGDRMPQVMNTEIVIEDGKIIEIRN